MRNFLLGAIIGQLFVLILIATIMIMIYGKL